MSSDANKKLKKRLLEIDEVISARDAICPKGAGKPALQKGAAVIKAGTTLLAAVFEAFVEELYEKSLDLLHPGLPAEVKDLKKYTSEKNNNANNHQVNNLFFYAGIPWIMQSKKVRWQKFSNKKVQETLGNLSTARNKIAHGRSHSVTKKQLVLWREFIGRLADRLDVVVADHIEKQKGARPW
ncbi:HEPN domain-containing protein [Paraburkholderia phenazinium]|uniref:HEPN domain-containing protein n=1 Tax=Paraburkholderia phenazinium TaxID=60549 RepID=UPI00158EEB8B|nr:HEPN domain-containing protein [Paraburkholderia phenazinium]